MTSFSYEGYLKLSEAVQKDDGCFLPLFPDWMNTLTVCHPLVLLAYRTFWQGGDHQSGLHIARSRVILDEIPQVQEFAKSNLGCSPTDLESVRQAVVVHDLGKLGQMELYYRQNRAPLTDTEWKIVYNHPNLAVEILTMFHKGIVPADIALLALYHHRFPLCRGGSLAGSLGYGGKDSDFQHLINNRPEFTCGPLTLLTLIDQLEAITACRPYCPDTMADVERVLQILSVNLANIWSPKMEDLCREVLPNLIAFSPAGRSYDVRRVKV